VVWQPMPAIGSTAAINAHFEQVRLVPTPEVASLFDHHIGAAEQRLRHRNAERLGGSQIDD
jgi:hypothetical protein